MMKKLVLLSIVGMLFLTISCFNCPDDEKIGELKLSEMSKSFFPYVGDQKLVFISNTGEELFFKSQNGGVHNTKNKVSVYKTCTEFKYDGQSSYQFFESETIEVVYFSVNPPMSFNLGLYTNTLRPETKLFYDKLIIDVTDVGTVGRGEIITDISFNDAYEESEFAINAPMEFVSSVTLNNPTFTDVYKSEIFNNAQIFYNKTQGLVGFVTFDSVTYNLDRIE
jgi:hypothetical protein